MKTLRDSTEPVEMTLERIKKRVNAKEIIASVMDSETGEYINNCQY